MSAAGWTALHLAAAHGLEEVGVLGCHGGYPEITIFHGENDEESIGIWGTMG